ncbi:cuticle protein 16.8-like [Stegodyphus dumicola]|uniref:cuticle protein 16.8-like n=1 Tax=Stegodyphus dumicola TaxID=202533 RepID=UPI0015AB1512|nr:cuticle protein 16.8-like [Stegodyphus dumicola]
MLSKVSLLLFIAVAASVNAFLVPNGEEGKMHVPHPYAFGYTVKDKGSEQQREETSDGNGAVKGSYGFTDERGVKRQVTYIADKGGYRAEVNTNEHGTAAVDPAAVKMVSSAHPYFGGAGAHMGPIEIPTGAVSKVAVPMPHAGGAGYVGAKFGAY